MTSNDIRSAFIRYFESRGHKHVRSSSLVPHNDPTILFTNAGMNQFKDYFLGNQVPDFSRAVTSQKVVRAGGKHNDLENVGRTARHHTFFEMLGNFSFGDYFKKEAITYAWEFLTDIIKLPNEKLWISVFENDDEAFDIWEKEIKVPKERILRLGEKDNFWSMGDTGPCGPCSEIHFDQGESVGCGSPDCDPACDCDRYLEIWNLVFMQFNRAKNGEMTPLPKPSIDTGMGLERVAAVAQGVHSNFDTDLFQELIGKIAKKCGYSFGTDNDKDVSCRVIADHLRASDFLITDGVIPSNEGRGYVLRRIIRRAARHGKQLGFQPGFFSELVAEFIPLMGKVYPEIEESASYVQILLNQEEQRFSSTLTQGMKILDDLLEKLKKSGKTQASGEDIFKLYDTFGFPVDLANDILEDRGCSFDSEGFQLAMETQKNRAKEAQEGQKTDLKVSQVYLDLAHRFQGNRFVGYVQMETQTKILALINKGKTVSEIQTGDRVEVLLEETPFYAESGGQVGDQGELTHDLFRIKIVATQSPVAGLNICQGEVVETTTEKVTLNQMNHVRAKVDETRRRATELNHTATHLLQAALQNVLGEHVKQAGSLVNEEKLRFDFSHYAPLTKAQLDDIEMTVNRNIRLNEAVTTETMEFDQAIKTGAMAIFGEKYGDMVRVITAGSSSKEFCGGCHTNRSGNIGICKIVQETGVSSGIRRIEALTGEKAMEWVMKNMHALEFVAQKLKAPLAEIPERMEKLEVQGKEKERVLAQLQKELQQSLAEKALNQVTEINGIKLLKLKINPQIDLKSQADIFRKEIGSGIVLLAQVFSDEKISAVLAITKDITPQLHAGKIMQQLADTIQGKGGGKPDMAQCGGTLSAGWGKMKEKLDTILALS